MSASPTRFGQPASALSVLLRQVDARKRADTNIHNLAKSMFQKGTKVMFKANNKAYFGDVIEVVGTPGNTWVRLTNLSTGRVRDVRVEGITGLVQED